MPINANNSNGSKGVILVDLDGTAMERDLVSPGFFLSLNPAAKHILADLLKVAQKNGYDIAILTARPLAINLLTKIAPGGLSASQVQKSLQKAGINVKTIYSSFGEAHGLKSNKMKEILQEYGPNAEAILLDDQFKQLNDINLRDEENNYLPQDINRDGQSIQAFDINDIQHVIRFICSVSNLNQEDVEKEFFSHGFFINNEQADNAEDNPITLIRKNSLLSYIKKDMQEFAAENPTMQNLKNAVETYCSVSKDEALNNKLGMIYLSLSYRGSQMTRNNYGTGVESIEKVAKKLTSCINALKKNSLTHTHITNLMDASLIASPVNTSKREKLGKLINSNTLMASGRNRRLRKGDNLDWKSHKTPVDIKKENANASPYLVNNALQAKIFELGGLLKQKCVLKENIHPRIESLTPFTDLVLAGGGVKGYLFIGALQEIKERGLFEQLESVGGSSVGAISAVAYGMGMNTDQITEIIGSLGGNLLMDGRADAVSGIKLLSKVGAGFEEFYVNEGEQLYKVCQQIVLKATLNVLLDISHPINNLERLTEEENEQFLKLQADLRERPNGYHLTFYHLHLLHKMYPEHVKDIFMTGSNIDTGELEYYDYENVPHMEVAKAMRISASIPGFLKAVCNDKDQRCVDGGLLANLAADRALQKGPDRKVLAINFDNATHYTPESDFGLKTTFRDKASMLAGLDRAPDRRKREEIIAKAIITGNLQVFNLAPGNLSSTNFKMTPEEIQGHIALGAPMAKKWLDALIGEQEFNIAQIHELFMRLPHVTPDLANRYAHPGIQQALCQYIKNEFNKAEDPLAYIQEVKNSSLYFLLGACANSVVRNTVFNFFRTPKYQDEVIQLETETLLQPSKKSGKV